MARKRKQKKEEGGPAGAPQWMVTYSDMVTLLLTFFVMLLAMASFDTPGRVDAVIASLRKAFGVGGYSPQPDPAQNNPAANTAESKKQDQIKPIVTELRAILSKKISDDLVKMTKTRTEVRVMLDERILFAPGSIELHPSAYGLLGDVAGAIEDKRVNLFVEGHTDGTGEPIRNWEISAMRAVAVVRALESRGVHGSRMQARGMGEYRPADIVEGNSSWNRRVELVVQSDKAIGYDALEKIGPSGGGGNAGR